MRSSDLSREILQFQKYISLTAQFIGDHRRVRAYGGDHGYPHAPTLHCVDQFAKITIAGEQNDVIKTIGHLEHIDGKLDIHVAFDFSTARRVGVLFGRFGNHGITVIVQPIDQRANRAVFLVFDQSRIVKSANQTTVLREHLK